MNADLIVVPPSSGAFSRRRTSFQRQVGNREDERPAQPPPTTTTSVSRSNCTLWSGSADSRAATGSCRAACTTNGLEFPLPDKSSSSDATSALIKAESQIFNFAGHPRTPLPATGGGRRAPQG